MNCWALAYLALQRHALFYLTYRNEERKTHSPRLCMTITVVSLNSTVSWSMHNTRTARKALLVSASSAIPPLSLSLPSYDFYPNFCAGNIYGLFWGAFFSRTGSVCLFLSNSNEERLAAKYYSSKHLPVPVLYSSTPAQVQASKQVQGNR